MRLLRSEFANLDYHFTCVCAGRLAGTLVAFWKNLLRSHRTARIQLLTLHG